MGCKSAQDSDDGAIITRRKFCKTALAAAGLLRGSKWGFARASQPRTEVEFEVPAGACDCHVHVYDPRRFPYAPDRGYMPEAPVGELRAHERALHFDRTIVVQPSAYGTNNACALDAVRRLGATARGIAVIDERTPESTLDKLDRAGFRGVRLTQTLAGMRNPALAREKFQEVVRRVSPRGWLIDFGSAAYLIEAIAAEVRNCPVPVVFEHFGGISVPRGLGQPGFGTLVSLVRSGKAYVKISGAADSIQGHGPDYADVVPFARALIEANPRRVIWGSNWPHPVPPKPPGERTTDVTPFLSTDDGQVLNMLPRWAPEAAIRRIILADNPAALYGF